MAGYQIVGASARIEGTCIDLPPVNPVTDSGLFRMPSGAGQSVDGEVGADDSPALAGQPDHVGALATPNVERAAGHQACGLGEKLDIGLPAEDLLAVGVSLVPVVRFEHGGHLVFVTGVVFFTRCQILRGRADGWRVCARSPRAPFARRTAWRQQRGVRLR